MANIHLAVDFGGGSGRVIAGKIEQGRLAMEEVHRFGNRQVRLGDHVYWDFPALFQDMKEGLRKAAALEGTVTSIGIDTWGVDFGLIDKAGNLIGLPVCYRDGRTQGMQDKVFARIDRKAHYATTGIQVLDINSVFQLYSLVDTHDPQLAIADRLLFMPDLFSYFLTGEANVEYCIASTSELLDARQRDWSWETLRALDLPEHLFGKILPTGTVRGRLRPEIARETGLGEVDVICSGGHDTQCAIAAVPRTEGRVAFLSSGTWSLLGVESNEPLLSEQARLAELTNEGGVAHNYNILQNITGLWFLQRLMGEWEARGEAQRYDVILPAAENAVIDTIIPVDDAAFQNPESMESALLDYCREHHLSVPQDKAEMVRCILQSLAQKYRTAVQALNELLPEPIDQLNIIGGGSQNALLNRLTANALGIPVLAGPVEATAMGSILIQAMAQGELKDLQAIRSVVAASCSPQRFEPSADK